MNKKKTAKNIADKEIELCWVRHIHSENIPQFIPDNAMIEDLAELFKVFGDPTRVKIIYALFQAELCVCEISDSLKMTQSAISHQLSILKKSRLVKSRKTGRTVYYSLDDEHVRNIFDCAFAHVREIYY